MTLAARLLWAALCTVLLAGAARSAPPEAERAPTVVDRAEALRALSRVDQLAGGFYLAHPDAEAIKARARGETVDTPPPPPGLVLRGLEPESWAAPLGLRDGDVLQTLDGSEIDGAATLLAVALRLNARLMVGAGWGFEARILRDGRPLTLRYVVQEEQTAQPANDPGEPLWKPARPTSSTP